MKQIKKWNYSKAGIVDESKLYSLAFIFNLAKLMIHDANCRDGIPFKLAFKILEEMGIATLKFSPYDVSNCQIPATKDARDHAKEIQFVYVVAAKTEVQIIVKKQSHLSLQCT